jgi:hypothetical protein
MDVGCYTYPGAKKMLRKYKRRIKHLGGKERRRLLKRQLADPDTIGEPIRLGNPSRDYNDLDVMCGNGYWERQGL